MDLDSRCGLPPAEPDTVRVGLVATFARWKGHLAFLQALAKVDRSLTIRGYIVGGPIYRTAGSQFSLEELQAEVARLNMDGRIGFTGFIDDTAAAVRTLDIVVHASTKPEPFGMAIVEAMACGKAVVVSDLGGARELFEEERTAIGHRPGDVAQLAEKIAFLAQNASLRARLGKQAAAAARSRFHESEMAANFRRVYESVIDGTAAAA
jgi:glycosyltransferase involved in cell wall biosynthesis